MAIAHDIIIRPIITERTTMDTAEGKYTFQVAMKASKTEIKHACEELFAVKVIKVNTSYVQPKEKRVRYKAGMTAKWKKAVVTIDQDPSSAFYLTKGGKTEELAKKYKTSIEEFGFGQ